MRLYRTRHDVHVLQVVYFEQLLEVSLCQFVLVSMLVYLDITSSSFDCSTSSTERNLETKSDLWLVLFDTGGGGSERGIDSYRDPYCKQSGLAYAGV